MKYLAALLFCLGLLPAWAQAPHFAVHRLYLPPEVAFYDNQFSGLALSAGQLLIMSESRLQDRAEAKLYAVALADLDHQLADSTYTLPFRKLPLLGLPALRGRINRAGQVYEGLEALLVDQQTIYFSVETATPSTNCYLLKGTLTSAAVVLDTTFLVTLPKPLAADGSHIYNAGFEALASEGPHLFAFFEYNSFSSANYVYQLPKPLSAKGSAPQPLPFAQLPFRLTDVTAAGKHRFVGLNYFFRGEGGDEVYRTPATDTVNARLISDAVGYKSYCRLVALDLTDNKFSWQPLWEFPDDYRSYNWEGIAAYKNGYFIINDKYTSHRPYQSTLLYLQPLAE